MKPLKVFIVAGILLLPASGSAQQVADSFVLPVNDYQSTLCFDWGSFRNGSRHVAQDVQCNHSGAQVRAAGNGKVMLAEPHGSVCSPDYNWGTILVIEHTLTNGNKVCTIYGHFSYTVGEGTNVTKNQAIGSVANLSCPEGWTDHVHFGVYNGAFGGAVGTYPSWLHGYLAPASFPGNYLKPDDFIAQHATPAFAALKTGQSVSVTPWLPPNGTTTLWVDYKNVGSTTWENFGGVLNLEYIELRSLTGSVPCVLTNGCAYDPTWTNPQRIETFTTIPPGGTTVPNNQTARFQFVARAATSTGECVQWVAPWVSGGSCIDGWGGVNFTVRTDATPPTGLTASVTPSTNNSNSFAFSWTTSTDGHSGLLGYYWSVNGGNETFTTSTSVAAGAWATVQGANTLNVRAVDKVANSVSAAPVTFTLTASPCPGREIPPSCVTYPTTPCYPAIAANLQALPDLTAIQWQSVGQPVREFFEPGKAYSIGFEYKTSIASEIELGLGTFNPMENELGLILSQSTLPPGFNEWRTFWSAPSTVTAEQLEQFSSLRFVRTGSPNDDLEYRKVRIVSGP